MTVHSTRECEFKVEQFRLIRVLLSGLPGVAPTEHNHSMKAAIAAANACS